MPPTSHRVFTRLLGFTIAVALTAGIIAALPAQRHREPVTLSAHSDVVFNPTALPANVASTTSTTTTTEPPPPATTTRARTPIPARSGDVTAAIREFFADVYDQATAVAHCESTLNPGAVSPDRANWGLFQINTVHRDDFEAFTGQPWTAVLDARFNAMYARKLYDGHGGWRRDWSCAWAAG